MVVISESTRRSSSSRPWRSSSKVASCAAQFGDGGIGRLGVSLGGFRLGLQHGDAGLAGRLVGFGVVGVVSLGNAAATRGRLPAAGDQREAAERLEARRRLERAGQASVTNEVGRLWVDGRRLQRRRHLGAMGLAEPAPGQLGGGGGRLLHGALARLVGGTDLPGAATVGVGATQLVTSGDDVVHDVGAAGDEDVHEPCRQLTAWPAWRRRRPPPSRRPT